MLYIQTYKRSSATRVMALYFARELATANAHHSPLSPTETTAPFVWHTTGQRWEENLSVMFLFQIQYAQISFYCNNQVLY